MMETYRHHPPATINGSRVVEIADYQFRIKKNLRNGTESPILLPVSNVLQILLEDGSRISIRPSGTEPLLRVMVEGKDAALVKSCAEQLATAVREAVE